eukprot:5236508-Pleurochrysis_carterae.AAC.1
MSRTVRAGAHSTARLEPDAPTRVRIGDVFVVPAEAYPNEHCCELGGLGWRVRILNKRKRKLLVDFLDARASDDRRFAPECHTAADLRQLTHAP